MRRQLQRVLATTHSGPVDCQLWGLKVRLHPDRNASEARALMRPDWLDPVEHAMLRKHVVAPHSVFVDIGANAGLYSLHAAHHAGESTRILAIEPSAEVLARFVFNLGLARAAGAIAPSVVVASICAAVGDHDGEARLSGTTDGSMSLVSGEGKPVALRRLASLLDEHGLTHISIMKIDVEGYEDRVLPPYLRDAPRSRWPQCIILEHAHRSIWTIDCIDDCLNRGYRLTTMTRNNAILALGGGS